MTIKLSIDTSGLQRAIGELQAGSEEAARPAAQAGAQVLYDEVKRNVATRMKTKTGKLSAAIYQVYSKDRSSKTHAVYEVSWNTKKAPHGHLLEYGHLQRYEVSYDPKTKRFTTHKDRPLAVPRQVAARPFVRPAAAKLAAAAEAMRKRYFDELQAKGLIR